MNLVVKIISNSVSPSIRGILNAIGLSGKRQVLMSAGRELYRQTMQNFGVDSEYKDKKWPALSPKYAKRVGHSNSTLTKSGELKNSIRLSTPVGDMIKIYTNNPYAAAQFFGSKKTNLPARNAFPINNTTNPSNIRLTTNSDRDMFKVITHRLTQVSNNSLPINTAWKRMSVEYGNPFASN